MGRHKLISDPEMLWVMFLDYKLEVKSSPDITIDYVGKDATPVQRMKEVPLTMEDYEEYVANQPGMPVDLGQYFSNEEGRYAEFGTVCSRIRRAIRADQIKGGMLGRYNPSITQRLNGLVDKVQTTVIKEQPLFKDDDTEQEKP